MPLALKLFVAYMRASTEEQVVSGLGLAAQEERLRAYVTAHGGELLRLYRDEGYSGTLTAGKRPGLGQLLADAERLPTGTTILVLRLDRLARHTLEALTIEAELRRRGLRLASVCEQLDAGTPAGRAMIQMLASFAELESGLIGERTFAAMRMSVSPAGARVGATPPLGYATDESGRFVVVPHEAHIVRSLVCNLLRLRSFSGVARALNAAGLLGRAGRPWSHTTVRVIADNAITYAGSRVWGKTSRQAGPRDQQDWLVVPNSHDPILSQQVADAVVTMLRRRDQRRETRRRHSLAERAA